MFVVAILIASAGLYSGIHKPLHLTGQVVCLPAMNGDPNAAAYCGIGLLGDNGKYYGLFSLNATDIAQGKIAPGMRVQVTGPLALRAKVQKQTRKMDAAIEVQEWSPAP